MDKVPPLVGNMLVKNPELLNGLPVIPGSRAHPAQLPLEFPQLFLGRLQPMGRIRHIAAIRHIEVGDRVFQPHGGLRRRDNRFPHS